MSWSQFRPFLGVLVFVTTLGAMASLVLGDTARDQDNKCMTSVEFGEFAKAINATFVPGNAPWYAYLVTETSKHLYVRLIVEGSSGASVWYCHQRTIYEDGV